MTTNERCIKKIKSIKEEGVFKDFEWDSKLGKAVTFKKINILYGYNGSGKTTLARIFASIGNKENPPVQPTNYKLDPNPTELHAPVRVFNIDFIKKNLTFTDNQDAESRTTPFAVIGEQNITIEADIKTKEGKLKELKKV